MVCSTSVTANGSSMARVLDGGLHGEWQEMAVMPLFWLVVVVAASVEQG